jgi:hypothetical protein
VGSSNAVIRRVSKALECKNLRSVMSQHKVTIGTMKYVFGWDPPLQSFFFQVHDTELPEESNPIYWYGDASTRLYELEDLAKSHG